MSRPAIMQKLARNAQIMGLTVSSQSQTAVVISNGSNNLTISYQDASFSPSQVGGVDGTASPYLGIGVGNPGKLVITAAGTAGTVPGVIDGAVAAQVLAMVAALANDIVLADSSHASIASLRGHSDLLGMGQ